MLPKSFKYAAKETMFVGFSIACMVVLVFITSIADASLDPAKIFTSKNVSNLLIGAAITIFGTIVSIPLGITETKTRVNPDGTNGRYIQEFNAYNTIRQKIEERRFMFNQWHYEQYLKELKSKRLNYLLEHNIFQAEDILELSREQILALTKSQTFIINGESVPFKALSKKQIAACIKVYDGYVTVHKLPDFYFLYVDGKSTRSFYDQAYYEAKDESWTLISKIAYKLFLGFVITCIFTGMVLDMTAAENLTSQYIIHTIFIVITRLFNVFTSVCWGFLMGQEYAYQQCYYINGKTQFLQTFDTDKDFVYKSVRQIAKEDVRNLERGSNETNGNDNIESEVPINILE